MLGFGLRFQRCTGPFGTQLVGALEREAPGENARSLITCDSTPLPWGGVGGGEDHFSVIKGWWDPDSLFHLSSFQKEPSGDSARAAASARPHRPLASARPNHVALGNNKCQGVSGQPADHTLCLEHEWLLVFMLKICTSWNLLRLGQMCRDVIYVMECRTGTRLQVF